jgi:hypothetical protein
LTFRTFNFIILSLIFFRKNKKRIMVYYSISRQLWSLMKEIVMFFMLRNCIFIDNCFHIYVTFTHTNTCFDRIALDMNFFHFEMYVNNFMQLQIGTIDITLTEFQFERFNFIVFVALFILKILCHLLLQVVILNVDQSIHSSSFVNSYLN